MGYSIWLNFCDESARKLQSKIQCFASKYSCPEFQPHLTLVGDIELELDAVRQLANTFAESAMPSEITVRDVGISDNYFMALFLLVDIPSEVQKIREFAAQSVNAGFYKLDDPHVSLAYGDLGLSSLREEKKSLMAEFLNNKLYVRGLSIVQSSKSVPVAEWKTVEKIDLSFNQTTPAREN